MINSRDATDRITEIFRADSPKPFTWHKDCRPSYMSKYKIEKLRRAGLKGMPDKSSSASTQNVHLQKISLRRKTPKIDWKQCILCQLDHKEGLHFIRKNESHHQQIGSSEV